MVKVSRTTWIMLIVGLIAFLFSSGRWNIGVMAWIWPFAMLYCSRQTQTKKQFVLLAVLLVIGTIVKWLNVLDAGYVLDAALCMIWGLCWIIPFLADRFIAQKLPGSVLSSLIFPSVFVALEFLRTFTLFGSYGMMAYTQTGFLPLVQVTSVIGSFGLSFLICWFGTIVVTVIERRSGWKPLAAVYLAMMIAVFGFGFIRMEVFPVDSSNTIKIASVISPFYGRFSEGGYTELQYDESEAYLISETERAAAGGAQIAAWNEEAFAIKDTEETQFIDTAKALAKDSDMILIIGYETADTDNSEDGLSINKSVIIQPDGTVTDYIKTKLVPVMETADYLKGEGKIPTVATEKGIISNIICFDDSYCSYNHGMGANISELFKDTEIMFVPSWDWHSVKEAHSNLAEFRAVENGNALVKPTYDGISTAVDYQGHVIKRFDTADTGFDTVQFADVPVIGVHTIYSRLGTMIDIIFCLLGFVAVAVGIVIARTQRSAKQTHGKVS